MNYQLFGKPYQSLQYPDTSREVVPGAVSKTLLPFAFFFLNLLPMGVWKKNGTIRESVILRKYFSFLFHVSLDSFYEVQKRRLRIY